MNETPALPNPTLPPDYYLNNFRILVRQVAAQYEDLLDPLEHAFLVSFGQLTDDAQRLLVRMLMRKGLLFRADKLVYQDIADRQAAARQLASASLIEIIPNSDVCEVLPLLSKAEWLRALAALPGLETPLSQLRPLKRAEFDQALQALLPRQVGPNIIGCELYQVRCDLIFQTFKLLFFGQTWQDLSEFVVRDLGHCRYENYPIHAAARLFSSRRQVSQHLEYAALLRAAVDRTELDRDALRKLSQQLPEADEKDHTLRRRVQRLRLELARQLERLGHADDALELYQMCEQPPARERIARILARQQNPVAALAVCASITDSPRSDEEETFASKFAAKLARQLQKPWPKVEVYQPPLQILELPYTGERVEHAVARHFSTQGACHYVENSLFCGVFALHYWDVLFAPVRGAFTHPFQSAPHDLYEADFLQLRQNEWQSAQARLDDINSAAEHYIALWQQKFGTSAPLINWSVLEPDLIATALSRIPADVWRHIFERLWQDLRNNRSGFPDLVHFPASGGFRLIEVKGPGDRLQPNQQRWMHYFHKLNVPHTLVQVVWNGA